jgi:zinc transporter, ZIP family
VSSAQILGLGAIAGSTIVLGLPMGRLHDVGARVKAFFTAMATGILLFLLWDVLTESIRPVEHAVDAHAWSSVAGRGGIALGGFAAGLLTLVYYDLSMKARRRKTFLGPGAASEAEFHANWWHGLSPARWLALFIATGIGLHNFSEGLAIGQSAARDELSLAYVLVIGFGLHNATEGFGIVAPLTGDEERPSWGFLGLLALIGGGPTFLGTVVGQAWTNELVTIGFLALAAGSILYVVMELLNVCRLFSTKVMTSWGVLFGITLGFATDFILKGAGV